MKLRSGSTKTVSKPAVRKRKLDEYQSPPQSSLDSIEDRNAPSESKSPSAKRLNAVMGASQRRANEETGEPRAVSSPGKTRNAKSRCPPKGEEKRSRVFRKQAPRSYLEKLERATTQRMFIIDRRRGGTENVPEETIEMAGTTGNIYNITISRQPSCTCPDSRKGNQCKHIVYVLHKVLKAPEHLQYQLALLSNELRLIFAHAPLPVSEADISSTSNRKAISGDCPICFTEFEPEIEEIVWCKAACGNNIHKGCFEQWAISQRGSEVKCVYCRTPWQGDTESLRQIKMAGEVNSEGYLNVGEELGLSGARDYSSYHQPWVRRQFGWGY